MYRCTAYREDALRISRGALIGGGMGIHSNPDSSYTGLVRNGYVRYKMFVRKLDRSVSADVVV